MRQLLIISLLIGFSGLIPVEAQEDSIKTNRKFHYGFELGTYLSLNNKIPFWQRSNQFGAVPQTGNSVYFRQMIESKPDTSSGFFYMQYCFDVMTIVGQEAKIILPEAILKLNFGPFFIGGGRFAQMMGLADSTLSSGSITWSGNSLSPWEVRISVPEYQKVFFKWFALKGHFSHGWFGEQQTVKDYFLHQKSLYARFGKPESKIHFYGGILHHAQWGGVPKYETDESFTDRFTDGQFPVDWYTYGKVVLPFTTPEVSPDGKNYGEFELNNRFGNHLGQIDIGGDIRIKDMNLFIYKQTIFESGQTFSSLANSDDGLFGISLGSVKPNSTFKKVVFEYLRTTNQGAYSAGLPRLLGIKDRHFGEETYYFNHMQYKDGWAYNGNTIGTPFLVPQGEIRPEKQSYPGEVFYNNNRIVAGYAGLQLRLNGVDIESKFSYSRNYGALFTPIEPVDQMSFAIESLIPTKKHNAFIKINIGIDHGDLIKDNYGVNIAYQRFW